MLETRGLHGQVLISPTKLTVGLVLAILYSAGLAWWAAPWLRGSKAWLAILALFVTTTAVLAAFTWDELLTVFVDPGRMNPHPLGLLLTTYLVNYSVISQRLTRAAVQIVLAMAILRKSSPQPVTA